MKRVYVGPTINGIATRNTTYEALPEPLEAAIKARPYLSSLCVPIASLGSALRQISGQQGGIYTLYNRALSESAEIQKGVN